eukprot:UN06989
MQAEEKTDGSCCGMLCCCLDDLFQKRLDQEEYCCYNIPKSTIEYFDYDVQELTTQTNLFTVSEDPWCNDRACKPGSKCYCDCCSGLKRIHIWRWAVFPWFWINTIAQWSDDHNEGGDYKVRVWWIFLTHQTFFATAIYYTLVWLGMVLYGTDYKQSDNDTLPHIYRCAWVLKTIFLPTSIFVCISFWIMVFNPNKYDNALDWYFNFAEHLIIGILWVIEDWITAIPYYFKHLWMPLVFSSCYSFWTWLYIIMGGTDNHGNDYIYTSFNWFDDPGTAFKNCILTVLPICMVAIILAFNTYCNFWECVCFCRDFKKEEEDYDTEIELGPADSANKKLAE